MLRGPEACSVSLRSWDTGGLLVARQGEMPISARRQTAIALCKSPPHSFSLQPLSEITAPFALLSLPAFSFPIHLCAHQSRRGNPGCRVHASMTNQVN